MRRLLLWCAQNRWLASHVPRWRFARRAVRRFLPGEGFDAALKAATDFKAHGVGALFTLLGENITDLSEANKVLQHYEEVLAASTGIGAEISVKPTQLGLDIDAAAAYANLQRLALGQLLQRLRGLHHRVRADLAAHVQLFAHVILRF